MAADIILQSLRGADRQFSLALNSDNPPPRVATWAEALKDQSPVSQTTSKALRSQDDRILSGIVLENVIVSGDDVDTLRQLKNSRQLFCVSPLWTSDVLAYLPLQPPDVGTRDHLRDLADKVVRSAVEFSRFSTRFNSVTGKPTHNTDIEDVDDGVGVPLYENAGIGKGISISDMVNDAHFPSYTRRVFVAQNAVDGASYTDLTFDAAVDLSAMGFYAGQMVSISKYLQASNGPELAKIASFPSANVARVQDTSATTFLSGTSGFTRAANTYMQGFDLVSDGDMNEDGRGSWTDVGTPTSVRKITSGNETGTRCLEIIAEASQEGAEQTLGDFPAGTDLYILARVKVTGGGRLDLQVYNEDETAYDLTEAPAYSGDWEWIRHAFQVSGSGQRTETLRFVQADGTWARILVDRVEVWYNEVAGSMEGTYEDESGGGGGTVDLAPGWNAEDVETNGSDELSESTDEHGGDSAQHIDVDANTEGIKSDNSPFSGGEWYYVGVHAKMASGALRAREGAGPTAITGLTDMSNVGSYKFYDALWQATEDSTLEIIAKSGTSPVGDVDDIVVRRLPGNPYDDAYYDLPDPLSTSGFQFSEGFVPDHANTDLDSGAAVTLAEFSRRTYDATVRTIVYYSQSTSALLFSITAGGTTKTASVSATYSAGDIFHFVARCTGAGAMYLDVYQNGSALTQGTQTGATIASLTGVTRVWLRGGSVYTEQARGSLSSLLVENTGAWTDAQVTALLDRMSGADARGYSLLKATHGRLYQLEDYQLTAYPGTVDNYKTTLSLKEYDRIGALAVQD